MPKPRKVPPSVKQAVRGELKDPQLAELAAHFFRQAGGTNAVAKLLWEEFRTAKPGSLIRQRVLEVVLRAVKFANERSGAKDDLGFLSEEDLDRETLEALAQMPGVADDAEQETTEAGPAQTGPQAQGPPEPEAGA